MIWRLLNRGHRRFQDLLSEYMDDRLDAGAQARLEAHLAGCPECSRDLESLKAAVGLLRSVPQVEVPRSFRLTEAMVSPPEPAPRPILMRSLQLSTAMAVMLLVSLVATDLSGGFDDVVQAPTAAIQTESLDEDEIATESQADTPPMESEFEAEGESIEMAAAAPVAESIEPEIAGAEEALAPSIEMAVEEDSVLELDLESLETETDEEVEPLIESIDQAEAQEERLVSQPAELLDESLDQSEGSGLARKIEIAAAALAGVLLVATVYLTFQRRRIARL